MKLRIYIPTLNRIDRQGTWDQLPKWAQKNTLLVCPEEEVPEHRRRGRNAVGCGERGIALTRDWVLAYAHRRKEERILMLDDDLVFQYADPVTGKIVNLPDDAHYRQMLDWMEEALGNYSHAGFAPRFLNWAKRGVVENCRMMYALGYHVPDVMEAGAMFSKGLDWNSTMEDFNMTLQLLTAGHPNIVSHNWRTNPGVSNVNGGCSTWRTTQMQTDSAHRLAKMFPRYVTVRPKKAWKGMEEGMYDVTIYWQKAGKGV